MSQIPILILAAGQSRRMRGRDKLMEDIEGQPLIRRQVEMACAAGQPVIVALPPAPHPRHAALEGLEVTRLEVPEATQGMGHTIAAGVAALPKRAEGVLLVLADLPELTVEDLNTVLQAFDPENDICILRGTAEDGTPGHPILFHGALFPALRQLTGDAGAKEIVRQNRERLRLIPLPGRHALRDLDTPEDWAEWRAEHRR